MIIDNQLWILLCQQLSHYENRGRGDDPILMTPLASYLRQNRDKYSFAKNGDNGTTMVSMEPLSTVLEFLLETGVSWIFIVL